MNIFIDHLNLSYIHYNYKHYNLSVTKTHKIAIVHEIRIDINRSLVICL